MATTVTVETGLGVANATSFVSVANCKAYLTLRGRTPPPDADLAPLLVRAGDYINSLDDRFVGIRTNRDQRMAFPRLGLYEVGFDYANNEIPQKIKTAQMELVWDLNQAVDINATEYDNPIKRLSAGSASIEYATATQPVPNAIEESTGHKLLASFFSSKRIFIVPKTG